jgi:tetratricopeptide (TPR) repeat protein
MKQFSLMAWIAVLALIVPLWAQAHEDETMPTGAPDKLGAVMFPVSCSPAAQEQFNRALAMLHSFFYPEAAKTFAKATELDPSCAMGYWGVAMSWWYPLWYPPTRESFQRGKAAIEKAVVTAAPTERERAYIAALGEFYGDFEKADNKARTLAYEKAMAAVAQNFPEDLEAAAFYALALQATANPNDKTYANQLKSAGILEKIFVDHPDHPGIAHYLIHAYDYPELAPRALKAARLYGSIAPAMPHALHMPSHTYIALGLWQDSIESNLAAGAVARKLGWIPEELHSKDYLVYAYLQLAQSASAKDMLRNIAEVKIDESARTLPVDYAFAAAPARYVLEQQRWEEAATLKPQASRFPATQALTHFARALGAAHLGATGEAEKEIAEITRIRDALVQSKQDYWAKQVEVQRQSAQAWLAWAAGDTAQAVEQMRSAAVLEESTYKHPITPGQLLPARELMGDLLLAIGQPGPALAEYEASLRANPNRFNGIFGAARSAELAGFGSKAADYYRKLLELAQTAESERNQIRQARLFLSNR